MNMYGDFETKQVGNKKQLMPKGYTLFYTGSHFMWTKDGTDLESPIHWDKWVIRRWAIEHSLSKEVKKDA